METKTSVPASAKEKGFLESIVDDPEFRKNLVGVFRSLLNSIANAIERTIMKL